MKYLISCMLVIFILTSSCSQKLKTSGKSDEELKAIADQIAHKYIIVDGHVDLPYRLTITNFRFTKELIGIPVSTDVGDFDYVRAKKGGLDAPFMSIYIPSSYQVDGGAKELADSLIDMVEGIIQAHPDKFASGKSPAEIKANFKKGIISLPMGMENGAALGDDLKNVAYFHKRGIRYITLTHATDNQICDSSYDETNTWNGLSPFGKEVVAEMNRTGIMVDISHVSDSTFYQVMELSKAPCIASHSSVRHYTPDFQRNMNDDMIKKLAEKGGVIHINFGSTFLDGNLQQRYDESRDRIAAVLEDRGVAADSEEGKKIEEDFRRDYPYYFYADVELVADHIDHVVKLVGIDHVGFGSDFDGVGDSLPTGLKDVSAYPNLIYVLLKRGYSEEDIARICYKNIFRVWEQVEKVAEKS